ncbi:MULTISPECIES: PopZ family protein [unclassified Mesorhizobium]|uniref:PopZ family protein n=1 Tax=unclassified Mesorhizobium TaxID=325217 RepID=UPI00301562C5
MAQASSVQREPSMEEILASIRRIIEDSDTVRKSADELAALGDDVDVAPVDNAVIEVDAFRAELRAARAAPEHPKPLSMAEVQAQIAEEAPQNQEIEQQPAESVAVAYAEPEVSEAPAETPVLAEPEWNVPQAAEAAQAAVSQPSYEDELDAALDELSLEQPVAPTPAVESPSPSYNAYAPVSTAKPDSVSAAADIARPAIISEHAGRQVAAAFGELSEAFAARSRKTFDEMAEEMMRPMLQDWLDNNLPTLVERLVREEIERVARGA